MLGCVITYFQSCDKAVDLLRNLIDTISNENIYLVLSSHSPVPIDIQEKCDYVIYQKLNMLDERPYSHGVAESQLINFGFTHLQSQGVEWAFKMSYDVQLSDINQIYEWIKDYHYQFVTRMWGEEIICTDCFFSNVNFFLNTFQTYNTIEEMFARYNMLEACWEEDVREQGLLDKIYTYPDWRAFHGKNKFDVFGYGYKKFDLQIDFDNNRYTITNNCGTEIIADVGIFDYFSDTVICNFKQIKFDVGASIWFAPVNGEIVKQTKNGIYCELKVNGEETIIRRNLGIKDFRNKHPQSRKFSKNKLDTNVKTLICNNNY